MKRMIGAMFLAAVAACYGGYVCVFNRASTPSTPEPGDLVYKESETILLLPFDEDAVGGVLDDKSPAGNDVAQTNALYRPHFTHHLGLACHQFCGDAGETNYWERATIITNYPFTVQVWLTGCGDVNQNKGDHVWGQLDTDDFRNRVFVMYDTGTSRADCNARDAGVEEDAVNTSAPQLFATNVWRHVVGVYASSSERRIYTDGTWVATNTASLSIDWSVVDSLFVGANLRNTGYTKPFCGWLSLLAVWTNAMSASEVTNELFEAQRADYGR